MTCSNHEPGGATDVGQAGQQVVIAALNFRMSQMQSAATPESCKAAERELFRTLGQLFTTISEAL